jgi:hypothetical protein
MNIAPTATKLAAPALFPRKRAADLETERLRKENKRLKVISFILKNKI